MKKFCSKQLRGVRNGFTMVELSLSIAFIAILSITVVLIITNAISAYHRGITLNQINTTGMELVDDLRAAVQNSPARSVKSECASIYGSGTPAFNSCTTNGGRSFVTVWRTANVRSKDGRDSVGSVPIVPIYGAFCTGSYSYIWNSGYLFTGEHTVDGSSEYTKASLKYKNANGVETTKQDFKLLKVADDERAVCKTVTRGNGSGNDAIGKGSSYRLSSSPVFSNGNGVFNIVAYGPIDEEPYDVLGESRSMVLYDLVAATPADSATLNNMFYSVSFILGTVQGGISINKAGGFCRTPSGYDENFDYCAINKFNFAAQANGG